MSDDESYYHSDSESEDESIHNVVVSKKVKPTEINHAKQFGGYEDDFDIIDDSEPDDAENDDNELDDNELDENNGTGKRFQVEDPDLDDEEIMGGAMESDDDADNSDIDIDDNGELIEKDDGKHAKSKKTTQLVLDDIDDNGELIEKDDGKHAKSKKTTQLVLDDVDDDEDDDEDEHYLQKFDAEINKNYIHEFHPECLNHNNDEIQTLAKVIRDDNNIVVDPLHRSLPFLTKYEKARILGQRAKQIEIGAKPFVKVPENIIDGYIIAELELREKKIPFIIKRPIPGGAFEYWHVKDLEDINF